MSTPEETSQPSEECTLCGHGGPNLGIPPEQCNECGGVRGSPPVRPFRCRQCNRKLIAIADECETWLLSLPDESDDSTDDTATAEPIPSLALDPPMLL